MNLYMYIYAIWYHTHNQLLVSSRNINIVVHLSTILTCSLTYKKYITMRLIFKSANSHVVCLHIPFTKQ